MNGGGVRLSMQRRRMREYSASNLLASKMVASKVTGSRRMVRESR